MDSAVLIKQIKYYCKHDADCNTHLGNECNCGLGAMLRHIYLIIDACEYAQGQIKKGNPKKALPVLRAALAERAGNSKNEFLDAILPDGE